MTKTKALTLICATIFAVFVLAFAAGATTNITTHGSSVFIAGGPAPDCDDCIVGGPAPDCDDCVAGGPAPDCDDCVAGGPAPDCDDCLVIA